MALTNTPTSSFWDAFIHSEKSDGFRLRLAERIQRLQTLLYPGSHFQRNNRTVFIEFRLFTHTERVKPPPPGKAPL